MVLHNTEKRKILSLTRRELEQFPCGCTGESMHSWPFSLKENGAAINPPLHSNREIALDPSPGSTSPTPPSSST
jgi:hypothetical protein